MEIILLPMTIAVVLSPPFMSAIMARNFGRSYWKWFFIGCLLPFIANVILFFIGELKPVENKKSI